MTKAEAEVFVLDEFRDNPFINRLPPLLGFVEALDALRQRPHFDPDERRFPARLRRECVRRLSRYFEPLPFHVQLEEDFGSMLRQGYVSRNPRTPAYIGRLAAGRERVIAKDVSSHTYTVSPTAAGFALIGCSGIGKSKSIERILELYPEQVIYHKEPFGVHQIVWLKLDCPFDGQVKALCTDFFKKVDELLGTDYYRRYGTRSANVNKMVAYMAQVANIHALGVLIIDEIQHLSKARGRSQEELMNFLVTLVNTIGVPIVTVGTLAAMELHTRNFRMARRANGLGSGVWNRLLQDDTWDHFVQQLWQYQWTRIASPLTQELRDVLYDESQGIIDVVIKLFMLCQLRAIHLGEVLDEPEIIDVQLVRQVARDNLKYISKMIDALRRNDVNALTQYDDLRPLEKAIEQAFADAKLPSRRMVETAATPRPNAITNPKEVALRTALRAANVSDDIAAILIPRAINDNPDGSLLDLVSWVIDQLREGPEPIKPRPTSRKSKVEPRFNIPSILNEIVEGVVTSESTAYDALRAAGYVADLLLELAV